MIQIDKDILKEYINQKYSDKYHITEVIDCRIEKKKFYKSMISKESYDSFVSENPELLKDGYIQMILIRPTWNGWSLVTEKTTSYKNKHLVGTFRYRESRKGIGFNINTYKNWLRDYKLNQLL